MSYAQGNKKQSFLLIGRIEGVDTGKIFIVNKTGIVDDTSIIKNGVFSFNGKISEPIRADLWMGEADINSPNYATIFIEPGSMNIVLKKDNFNYPKMFGSKSQNDWYRYINMDASKFREARRVDSLSYSLYLLYSSSKKENDPNKLRYIKHITDSVNLLSLEKWNRLKTLDSTFIVQNPASYVAAYKLLDNLRTKNIKFPSLESLYNRMPFDIQNSYPGQRIAAELTKVKLNKIGDAAKSFVTKDIDGQTLNLADYLGKKYIILEFWASWCVPCRANNPHLKEVYQKYHQKGLEIVGISLDTDIPAWRKAVIDDGIGIWRQILQENNLLGEAKKIKDIYRATIIPLQILINKEGVIIGMYGYSYEEEPINMLDKKLITIFK